MKGRLRVILVVLMVAWSITGQWFVLPDEKSEQQPRERQERKEIIESGWNDSGLAIEEIVIGGLNSAGGNLVKTFSNAGHSVIMKVVERGYHEKIRLIKSNCWLAASKRPPLYFVFALHKMLN
ncbi:MAG: hypothetical protein MJZ93_03625 [Paludibacteraceae bacterium]|nr:hypothetical protein [Paludibacteraceae bacterium]